LIECNPKTSPISIENHFWYYKLYIMFWSLIALFSLLRFIFFSPESFMSEKTDSPK
jgi:polyferredoxin